MPIPRRLIPLQTPLQKTITSYVLETCLDLDLVSSTVFSACRSNKRSLLHINITILFLLPSIDWHTLTFSISSRRAAGRRRRTGGGQQRCGTEVLVVFCPPLRMVHFGAARRRRRWASPDVVIGHSGPRLSPVNQWTCFASQKKHWHNYEKCCGGDYGPHYSFSGVWRCIQVEVLYELWWSRRPLLTMSKAQNEKEESNFHIALAPKYSGSICAVSTKVNLFFHFTRRSLGIFTFMHFQGSLITHSVNYFDKQRI